MKIERMTEIETTDIRIGDRVHIGNYTATCQKIMPKGAPVQDDAMRLGWERTGRRRRISDYGLQRIFVRR